MTGQRPETRFVGALVPMDRVVPAQVAKCFVRRAVGEELDVAEVDPLERLIHCGMLACSTESYHSHSGGRTVCFR